jgi:phenazine biosynthesis protein phzE
MELEPFDLVVVGPGPGDPRDLLDPRIIALRRVIGQLLCRGAAFLCVCLSHQVLAAILGLDLVRKRTPAQGVQEEIDLFGHRERVGFYNTFVACSEQDLLYPMGLSGPVQVSRDPHTGEVHALRGAGFVSTQFHPESLLTQNGVHIMAELVGSALSGRPASMLAASG